MKDHLTATKNTLLLAVLMLALLQLFSACQNEVDTPTLSCPGLSMKASIQNTTNSLNLVSNVVFRQQTDTGGVKFMSLEAISDTMKVLLNVMDGVYDENALKNDSLYLKTYIFSTAADRQGGLVVVSVNDGIDYKPYTTDTSSITITRINTIKKTISGNFYFAANNRTISGKGTFQNACYVSLP
ncbi:hypothetical protein CLV51_101497 [Chitinophaga niastensis]|uniref:Uncharacterized protein n=1 Tax=Chitinophaga niastensis TaxID=536980 RepID=A0A2P8HSI2_CHINA|nr:hypothetical protein [Chitinophaga niastensis]PSL49167.1 hypothetical protein CLV51_101497 [Chitinophaga niastensis]